MYTTTTSVRLICIWHLLHPRQMYEAAHARTHARARTLIYTIIVVLDAQAAERRKRLSFGTLKTSFQIRSSLLRMAISQ